MVKLQVVFTVVLSVLTLILLYKQYRIQQYRVKMDLFDRRFKVYSYVRKFIHTGSSKGGTELKDVQDFLSNIPEYEFIFDNDGEIVKYIDELVDRGLTYHHLREQIKDLNSYPIGYERDQLIKEKHPHMVFFTSEFRQVKNRFNKYLHLGEVDDLDSRWRSFKDKYLKMK